MMQYLDSLCPMDFEGQKRAERIYQVIVTISAIIGFVIGYIFQMYSYSIITLGGGCLLSCLITFFNWPLFQLKPLHWQKPLEQPDETKKSK